MEIFSGFPVKTTCTPMPDLVFSSLLPQIQDTAELRVTLHLIWLLHQKQDYPRYVTLRDILEDRALLSGFSTDPAAETSRGLALALERGTFLRITVEEKDGKPEDLYFLNSDADRGVLERMKRGKLVSDASSRLKMPPPLEGRSNIFALYEDNIGLLTPIIAEELKEAERLYPTSWIEDAFKLAIRLNRRRWQTVAKILERWATEGKDDGKPGRDSKKDTDPGRSWKERYPDIVRD